MGFLEELYQRRKMLADVLSMEEYSGIKSIVKDLYPDRVHFIYELLQNAEDANAHNALFILEDDGLIFEHDGRPFNEADIEGISNIGRGTKSEDQNTIGQFGVGFKAVFAYTETPYIYSPTYSFKICDLVLPVEIPQKPNLNEKTRFEFPFNNSEKQAGEAYNEIRRGLSDLSDETLLFLSSIDKLTWQLSEENGCSLSRIEHSATHIEIIKQGNMSDNLCNHFLRFMAEVDGLERQKVAIAYKLNYLNDISNYLEKKPLVEQFRIDSVNPGLVAIYFPAEKETSGMRFHLHAPFVPELSRASVKDCKENDSLYEQLAKLAVTSLEIIRDSGFLTREFLGVLPNHHDTIPERYQCIRTAIIDSMNNKPLTPTYTGSHYPAYHLLQARQLLKDLLNEEDLEFLIDYEGIPPKWAIANPKNTDADHFLSGLGVKKWDVLSFVEMLRNKTSAIILKDGPPLNIQPKEVMEWLESKPYEWTQTMYSLLFEELSSYSYEYQINDFIECFKHLRIVRRNKEGYGVASECFFPVEEDNDEINFPRVAIQTYTSGKSKLQQKNAKEFLERIGVRTVGDAELIEVILKQRYSVEENNVASKVYLDDLMRFMRLVEKSPNHSNLFSSYNFLQCTNGDWVSPDILFLDLPYEDTGLASFYEALGDEAFRFELSEKYYDSVSDVNLFISFIKAVGVQFELPIKLVSCQYNSQWNYLNNGWKRNMGVKVNRDYTIDYLQNALECPSLRLSKLIWRLIGQFDEKYLIATFSKNNYEADRVVNSQLVNILEQATWVPLKDGSYVRPCDASRNQLPGGFPYDEEKEWLNRVKFGQNADSMKDKLIYCEVLGISDEELELTKALQEYPDLKAEVLNMIKRRKTVSFPQRPVVNLERRQEKLKDQVDESSDKKFEKRSRSVRTSSGSIDQDTWLRAMYTNEDEEMICQICKEEMPFRKRDGEYYFEAVEAFPGDYFSKELEAQYLALCPLCAAMYKELIKKNDSACKELFQNLLQSEDLEIPMRLGERETSIRFVETHIVDIRTILQGKD